MKRLLVMVATVLAGCSGEKLAQATPVPETPVVGKGRTLGTFTATVDLAAGTIDVRSEPTGDAAGTGPSSTVLLELTGLVASNGAGPWRADSTEHGCGLVPTWGANVKITSNYPASSATGVYAEITSFGGGVGNFPSCNRALSVYPDLANTYGLWSYPGVIAPAGTQAVNWTFPYVTASRFTFSGRLVGALLDNFAVTPAQNGAAIAINGTNIVYGTSNGIAFANPSGGNVGTPRNLGLGAKALATTGSRIWFVTAPGGDGLPYVGYTKSDGADGGAIQYAAAPLPNVTAIVPDPTSPDVAWFLSATSSLLVRMDTSAPDPANWVLTPYGTVASPRSMVVGSDGKIYVTSQLGNVVQRWDPAAPGSGGVNTSTTGACANPTNIIADGIGSLWFTASGAVCRMTQGSTVAPRAIAVVGSPATLCVGPGGYVWYMTSGGSNDGTLVRVVDGASSLWTFNLGTNASSLACTTGDSGVAWVLGGTGSLLTRLSPSQGGIAPPPLAINLGAAATFGIASRAGLTSTGVTVINGDVALSPTATCTDSTGGAASASRPCNVKNLPPSATGMTVSGSIYFAADPFDNGVTAARIMTDLNAAWVQGKAKVATRGEVAGAQLAGQTFLPGIYENAAALGLAVGGTATMDAQNDPNAIFIFKVGSSLTDSGTLGNPSTIALVNGAQARNVWFVVESDVTIGSGTQWKGNILAGNTVTINIGSTVLGRVLAGAAGAGAFTLTGAAFPSVTSITVPP